MFKYTVVRTAKLTEQLFAIRLQRENRCSDISRSDRSLQGRCCVEEALVLSGKDPRLVTAQDAQYGQCER